MSSSSQLVFTVYFGTGICFDLTLTHVDQLKWQQGIDCHQPGAGREVESGARTSGKHVIMIDIMILNRLRMCSLFLRQIFIFAIHRQLKDTVVYWIIKLKNIFKSSWGLVPQYINVYCLWSMCLSGRKKKEVIVKQFILHRKFTLT